MRSCNIRITGIEQEPGLSSTALISKLLKEVLNLEKDILFSLAPRKSNGKPQVIVA